MSETLSRREWSVRLDVECAKCARTDSAEVGSTSCEDARQNAMKVLRYRGWSIGRKHGSDLCPDHAPPIPKCELCGEPTPRQYGFELRHITDADFTCKPCYRRVFDLKRKEWRLANQ